MVRKSYRSNKAEWQQAVMVGEPLEFNWKDGLANIMRSQPTPAEAKLWRAIKHGVDGVEFERQVTLHGYILDFYCESLLLCVEVDGLIHQGQVKRDRIRDGVLNSKGTRVLRFSNDLVLFDMPFVLQTLRAAVKEFKFQRDKWSSV